MIQYNTCYNYTIKNISSCNKNLIININFVIINISFVTIFLFISIIIITLTNFKKMSKILFIIMTKLKKCHNTRIKKLHNINNN